MLKPNMSNLSPAKCQVTSVELIKCWSAEAITELNVSGSKVVQNTDQIMNGRKNQYILIKTYPSAIISNTNTTKAPELKLDLRNVTCDI
jgi:hypothetical protein